MWWWWNERKLKVESCFHCGAPFASFSPDTDRPKTDLLDRAPSSSSSSSFIPRILIVFFLLACVDKRYYPRIERNAIPSRHYDSITVQVHNTSICTNGTTSKLEDAIILHPITQCSAALHIFSTPAARRNKAWCCVL